MTTTTPAAAELHAQPFADQLRTIADEFDHEAQAHHRARRTGRCTYARAYADALRFAASLHEAQTTTEAVYAAIPVLDRLAAHVPFAGVCSNDPAVIR